MARGFAGDVKHLTGLIKESIGANGFSLLDVFQPCVSFDRVHTFQWYQERIYDLNAEGHDTGNHRAAMERAKEWGDPIPIGIFYRNPEKLSYEQQVPVLKDRTLVKRQVDPSRIERVIDSFL